MSKEKLEKKYILSMCVDIFEKVINDEERAYLEVRTTHPLPADKMCNILISALTMVIRGCDYSDIDFKSHDLVKESISKLTELYTDPLEFNDVKLHS